MQKEFTQEKLEWQSVTDELYHELQDHSEQHKQEVMAIYSSYEDAQNQLSKLQASHEGIQGML